MLCSLFCSVFRYSALILCIYAWRSCCNVLPSCSCSVSACSESTRAALSEVVSFFNDLRVPLFFEVLATLVSGGKLSNVSSSFPCEKCAGKWRTMSMRFIVSLSKIKSTFDIGATAAIIGTFNHLFLRALALLKCIVKDINLLVKAVLPTNAALISILELSSRENA